MEFSMHVRGVLREEVLRYPPAALERWRGGRRSGYPGGPRFAHTRDRRPTAHHFGEALVAASLEAEGHECWAGSYRLFERPTRRSWKEPQSADIRRRFAEDDLPDPRSLPARVDFAVKDPAVVARHSTSGRWTFCEVVRDRSELSDERRRGLCLLRVVYRASVRLVRVVRDNSPAPPPVEHVVDLHVADAGLWWTYGSVPDEAEYFELAFGSMVAGRGIPPVARVARGVTEGGAPFVVDLLPVPGHDVRWLTKARRAAMADLDAHLLGARDGTGWNHARLHCGSEENFSGLIHWAYHPAGDSRPAVGHAPGPER